MSAPKSSADIRRAMRFAGRGTLDTAKVGAGSGVIATGGCLALVAIAAVVGSLRGWALMLVLGAAHSYAPSVPPIAFWPCVGLALAVGLVLGGVRGHGKASG